MCAGRRAQSGHLEAQERVWCGSWGIAGRFSTANSATDLLHERGSSFKIVMLQFFAMCVFAT